jgi:hypothetical protein
VIRVASHVKTPLRHVFDDHRFSVVGNSDQRRLLAILILSNTSKLYAADSESPVMVPKSILEPSFLSVIGYSSKGTEVMRVS